MERTDERPNVFKIVPDDRLINDIQRVILDQMAMIPEGMATPGLQSKYWLREVWPMVSKGFVAETDGVFSITQAGRDVLRSNHR